MAVPQGRQPQPNPKDSPAVTKGKHGSFNVQWGREEWRGGGKVDGVEEEIAGGSGWERREWRSREKGIKKGKGWAAK